MTDRLIHVISRIILNFWSQTLKYSYETWTCSHSANSIKPEYVTVIYIHLCRVISLKRVSSGKLRQLCKNAGKTLSEYRTTPQHLHYIGTDRLHRWCIVQSTFCFFKKDMNGRLIHCNNDVKIWRHSKRQIAQKWMRDPKMEKRQSRAKALKWTNRQN